MKCDTCRRAPRETCGVLSQSPDGCEIGYVYNPDAVIARLEAEVAALKDALRHIMNEYARLECYIQEGTWAKARALLEGERNADFIASSRSDIPALSAALREAWGYINLFQPPVPGESGQQYRDRLAQLLRNKKELLAEIAKGREATNADEG